MRWWLALVLSNERAVANARAATVECSRRRVERAEVEAFLAACAGTVRPGVRVAGPGG